MIGTEANERTLLITVGRPNRPLCGGERRLGADEAALAFEAVEEGGFLAAHIGAGAEPHFQVEDERRAGDALANEAAAPRRGDRRLHRRRRVRIFRADVDVAFGRSDRDAGDRHAFDQYERIAFHDHAVGEGAAVALVGVADDVFLRRLGLRHGAPFDPGRETGAAAAAQAGLDDVLDGRLRTERERAFNPLAAAMRAVVFERARVDHAAAREGEPRLPLEPGDFLGQPVTKLMPTVGEERSEQAFGVARRDRPIRHAAHRRFRLDHRLEPVEPTRAGANDIDRDVPPRGGGAQCGRHLLGAHRQSPGIDRYEQPQRHCCVSASKASRWLASSRPMTRPSSMADGAVAHSPRQ